VESDVIPEEILELEVFYNLSGSLVFQWNQKKTSTDMVNAVITKVITHPASLSPADKKVYKHS
jgi:hypothetical protein